MAQFNLALTPDEALKKLMDGNANFAAGNSQRAKEGLCERRRQELLAGQKPFVVIICCSDSRVTPQYLFDLELGEPFVIRVAGNVIDSMGIGSIEYAVEQFDIPLVVVLGHQKCGAVKAAMDGDQAGSDNLRGIVEKIVPRVERVRGITSDPEVLWHGSVVENALGTAREIAEKSTLVSERINGGRLKVVAGVYSLKSLKVEIAQDSGCIERIARAVTKDTSTRVCNQKSSVVKLFCPYSTGKSN